MSNQSKSTIFPSNKTSVIDRIVTLEGDLDHAILNQSVTLTLKDEIDCSRGQTIASEDSLIKSVDQFETFLIWMDESSLIPNRSYHLKLGLKLS